MVNAKLYVEGGGDSKDLHVRCREGFRRLFERCGLEGRMPRIVACGGRGATRDDFATAHVRSGAGDFVAMLVDSETPVADIDCPWDHLKIRDGWDKPNGAADEQVLLMTTCMETWILVDRQSLRAHYGSGLQETALPSLSDMESRPREAVQDALERATRSCKNRYAKGRRSFEILARLDPATLSRHLPSFARCKRILSRQLGTKHR